MKTIIDKQLENFDNLTSLANISIISRNIGTYEELISDIKQDYINKSTNYFSYFINNIVFAKNRLTGKYYVNQYNSDKCFRYLNNFEVDREKGKYNIVEDNEGHYLAQQDKLYALKIFSKVNYLEYANNGTVKQFITLTLPSKYHKYKLKSNIKNKAYKEDNFIKNKNYIFKELDFKEAIEKSIKRLNEIERRLQIEFNKYATRYIKKTYNMTLKEYKEEYNSNIIQKIKMIEPHKSLTPHLHAMYWIEPEFAEIFNRVYDNIIKLYELNNDFCKNETIEQAKASTYIMKYLMKNLQDDETESAFANKYRRYFSKSRFFTSSNFIHTTQKEIDLLYKYLNKHNKAFLEYLKSLKTPLYWSLEQLIIKKVITFEYDIKAVERDKSTIIEKQVKQLKYIEKTKQEQLSNLEQKKEALYSLKWSNDIHPESYNFENKLFPFTYYKQIKKADKQIQYDLLFNYIQNEELAVEEKIEYFKNFNIENELNKIEAQIKKGLYVGATFVKYIKKAEINLNFIFAVNDDCEDFEAVLNNIDKYIQADFYDIIYEENSFIPYKLDYKKVCEIVENPFEEAA